ncbi:hypothetical protein PVAP13_7NG225317 [Panicum virgatum]|uniref:Uncharacterized protein n=1 Tax=Panicum virgatum TaxID=38727 RepID=A0A8T0PZH5_PANVG|nr:hypothetical protein PVAP13_7NG225317 [Panicum virgatum]
MADLVPPLPFRRRSRPCGGGGAQARRTMAATDLRFCDVEEQERGRGGEFGPAATCSTRRRRGGAEPRLPDGGGSNGGWGRPWEGGRGPAHSSVEVRPYHAVYGVSETIQNGRGCFYRTRCRGSVCDRVLDARVVDAIACPVWAAFRQRY